MSEAILNDECVHCNDKECHDGENFCRQAMKDNSFYKNARLYKGLEVIQRPTYEELEKENEELNDKLNNLSKVAEVRLANWQKYEKENEELKRDKSELCNAINEKLSKAKGLIEKLLIVSCNSEILIQYPNCKEVLEARVALEQFLMEK